MTQHRRRSVHATRCRMRVRPGTTLPKAARIRSKPLDFPLVPSGSPELLVLESTACGTDRFAQSPLRSLEGRWRGVGGGLEGLLGWINFSHPLSPGEKRIDSAAHRRQTPYKTRASSWDFPILHVDFGSRCESSGAPRANFSAVAPRETCPGGRSRQPASADGLRTGMVAMGDEQKSGCMSGSIRSPTPSFQGPRSEILILEVGFLSIFPPSARESGPCWSWKMHRHSDLRN